MPRPRSPRGPRRRWRRRAGAPRTLPGLGLGGLGELGEAAGVARRHLGEDLPVEPDAGLLQCIHEHGVRQSGGAARGVDARDPQPAAETLLGLAIAVRERARAQDGLGGGAIETRPSTDVALGLLEDLLPAPARLGAALGPWHDLTSSTYRYGTSVFRRGSSALAMSSALPSRRRRFGSLASRLWRFQPRLRLRW